MPKKDMRVGILTVQVPFIQGGAELHATSLLDGLRRSGHEAEIISIPFKWNPIELIPQQMLACRLFDVEESCGVAIDKVIGLKFPAYLISHSYKIMWILHQHRSAYDLWDVQAGDFFNDPKGDEIRQIVHQADINEIPKAKKVFANSRNVARRLDEYCGIQSKPLYHPPPYADQYRYIEDGEFLLMPSRVNALKRQKLVVEALFLVKADVKLCFMGLPDDAAYASELLERSSDLPEGRAIWLGGVSNRQKLELYGSCLAVVFPPIDEDYGYVTLEAMLASKPVITCTDSGGPLEFVVDDETGIICSPDPPSLAAAMDRIFRDRAMARRYGRSARRRYDEMGLCWENVVECLLA